MLSLDAGSQDRLHPVVLGCKDAQGLPCCRERRKCRQGPGAVSATDGGVGHGGRGAATRASPRRWAGADG